MSREKHYKVARKVISRRLLTTARTGKSLARVEQRYPCHQRWLTLMQAVWQVTGRLVSGRRRRNRLNLILVFVAVFISTQV